MVWTCLSVKKIQTLNLVKCFYIFCNGAGNLAEGNMEELLFWRSPSWKGKIFVRLHYFFRIRYVQWNPGKQSEEFAHLCENIKYGNTCISWKRLTGICHCISRDDESMLMLWEIVCYWAQFLCYSNLNINKTSYSETTLRKWCLQCIRITHKKFEF